MCVAELTGVGHATTEFELISIDEPWQAESCDAVAAQMRDAGVNIKRTILPSATFWNDWAKYPFSATEWNMRPLGVQVLNLAYRSGVPWNESAFSNAEFDKFSTASLITRSTNDVTQIQMVVMIILVVQMIAIAVMMTVTTGTIVTMTTMITMILGVVIQAVDRGGKTV